MKPQFTQILDSRGNPTIQARIVYQQAPITTAVPSGASTGVHEAHELRDGEEAYAGKGVTKALLHAQELADALDWEQASVTKADKQMIQQDATPNKSRYGANAILANSLLQTRLQARQENQEVFELIAQIAGTKPSLPLPFANVINGGEHADNDLMMQEFMIVPIHAKSFAHATQQVAETYHELKKLISETYGADQTSLGDEGGFAPGVKDAFEVCDLLMQAAKQAGHELAIAMDPAASEFYDPSKGYQATKGAYLSAQQLSEYYLELAKKYPVISIEDAFDQDDFEAFAHLRESLKLAGKNCQVVGDDLTVSNTKRIQQAIDANACDSLLLKINQIGTITQAIQAANLATSNGWTVMVSHRSGETEDSFIADLAVGLGSGQIKLGAPARGERTAKYNRLLTIESSTDLVLAPHVWQNL